MQSTSRQFRTLALIVIASGCGHAKGQANSVSTTPSEQASPNQDARPLSAPVIAFSSKESMRRLARSSHKVDFFQLVNHFEGQQNLGMCGPTSAVIILNTLHSERDKSTRPTDPTLFPEEFAAGLPPGLEPVFHRYSQGIFFDDPRVTKVKKRETFYGRPTEEGARDPGMQLRQLHEIFLQFGVDSEIQVVDDKASLDSIRQRLRENLDTADDYIVVNYHRPVLQQSGGGHISPVAAYDEVSDSFLVLDVNPNGKTWVWVRADTLIASMRTFDTIENRGYLLLKN
jgi:hypothetical protein